MSASQNSIQSIFEEATKSAAAWPKTSQPEIRRRQAQRSAESIRGEGTVGRSRRRFRATSPSFMPILFLSPRAVSVVAAGGPRGRRAKRDALRRSVCPFYAEPGKVVRRLCPPTSAACRSFCSGINKKKMKESARGTVVKRRTNKTIVCPDDNGAGLVSLGKGGKQRPRLKTCDDRLSAAVYLARTSVITVSG